MNIYRDLAPCAGACDHRTVTDILGNPKVYVVMLILCLLLAGHYYTSHFTKRVSMPQGYLG